LDDARLAMARLSPSRIELEEILRRICQISSDALAVERVGIWLFVGERTALSCVTLFERARDQYSGGATLQVADFPSYFEALESRRTIPAESAGHDPRTTELQETYLVPLGIEALLDAPILLDGVVVGVVCHEHVGGPREWSTEERDFAGTVADLVVLKMKGAELEQARRLRQTDAARQAEFRQRSQVAQLAAGVAHDFRNVLAVVIGSADEIRHAAAEQPEIARLAEDTLVAARRGADLAQQLMDLARNQAGNPRVVDPSQALATVLPLLQQSVGGRHQIEFTRGEPVGRVFVDPTQMERVVLNLVANARDAMAEGGVIHVRLGEKSVSEAVHNGHMVMLEVRDSGAGIDPSVLPRIFDPFFTTKARQAGSGLGLAVVKHVVEMAGGRVEVESAPGKGSTFRVLLPRVAG
jgi:signal transduction histidine kinase